jgi:hypothetical protein
MDGMKIFKERQLKKRKTLLNKIVSALLRLCGWSAGFSSLIAMTACPFCGRQGCVVGAAGAGVLGVTFGILIMWGRRIKNIGLKWFLKPASKPLH